MSKVSPAEQAAADAFYQSLGRAVSRWASVEHSLEVLFGKLLGLPRNVSRRVFHSARSFQGRYDMLAAALDATTGGPPGFVPALRLIIGKAKAYSVIRNALVHDTVAWRGDTRVPDSGHFVIFSSQEPLDPNNVPRPILKENVDAAGQHFRMLSAVITHAVNWDGQDQLGSPERLTWLVGKLPSQPHESEPDPTLVEEFLLGHTRALFPD